MLAWIHFLLRFFFPLPLLRPAAARAVAALDALEAAAAAALPAPANLPATRAASDVVPAAAGADLVPVVTLLALAARTASVTADFLKAGWVGS